MISATLTTSATGFDAKRAAYQPSSVFGIRRSALS